ncbi:hypothetical protein METBIDRAFT_22111, partial [Metschnikowia bicuspidata var. bicuspidata NRRL YB-4993]
SASNLYQLNASTAPRFLHAQAIANCVAKHHLSLTGFRYLFLEEGHMTLMCRVHVSFYYSDGSSATALGTCCFFMARDLHVQQLDCRISAFQRLISMEALQQRWAAHQAMQKNGQVQPQDGRGPDFYQHMALDAECCKTMQTCGLSPGAMRVMQIGDVMACLHPLMRYTRAGNIASPLRALERFVETKS